MAFTRYNYDSCRTDTRLKQNMNMALYQFNVPGNGLKPYYVDDPQIRLTKWGGNLRTNQVNLESDFRGLTKTLTKDCQNYMCYAVDAQKIQYPSYTKTTDQSRVTHPAWWYRDVEQTKNAILPLNPQENTCYPFEMNVNTQLLEKDSYMQNHRYNSGLL